MPELVTTSDLGTSRHPAQYEERFKQSSYCFFAPALGGIHEALNEGDASMTLESFIDVTAQT